MSKHSSSQQKKMSHDEETTPELDLKLNLSPPGTAATPPPPLGSPSSSAERSPSCSCVSRELSPAADDTITGGEVPMMLVGCPRCLMYVMVPETNPKCPQCKSTVLLDFFHQDR